MTFDDLVAALKKIEFDEVRTEEENYFELVVGTEELEPLSEVLQSFFGPPLKPAGEDPSRDAGRYSAPYGGVRRNQTMYFKENDGSLAAALLWPWGNGDTLTVKLVRDRK